MKQALKLALVGNPNVGKSTLFNQITGLKQKTGNFPGVTIEGKSGLWDLDEHLTANITDLPGTYSLYPKSADERVVFDYLVAPFNKEYPDLVLIVVDQTNLRRNLLLTQQVIDLGLPCIVLLNLHEEADKKGKYCEESTLSQHLTCPVIKINARSGAGIDRLKTALQSFDTKPYARSEYSFAIENTVTGKKEEENLAQQQQDVLDRYAAIDKFITQSKYEAAKNNSIKRHSFDRIAMHPIGGFLTFLAILFIIFQLVYQFASYPMDVIDGFFGDLSTWVANVLPAGPLSDLLTEGVIAGLGGVVIFVPQIAFLFLMLAILEESGYMSRVMFLFDPIMRKFGLSGRSIIPMVSAAACAIPSIMAARAIENPRERMITIMVAPLISCAARLPVYAVLIAFLVPSGSSYGIFNLQGILLFAMYLLGVVAALLAAMVFKAFMKEKHKSYFVMEIPDYRFPLAKNIGIFVYEKCLAFVWQAGKIILAISIILWALASYGPGKSLELAEKQTIAQYSNLHGNELDAKISSKQLEASYAGILGKSIEPVIKPLGYDWRIGIALITSFAAREVFVGTMSTIFSLGDEEDTLTIKERLAKAKRLDNNETLFTTATVVSLLVFYAFAMQCMSTLAVTKKETNSWKWPIIQLVYMSFLAYGSAWAAYVMLL